MFYCNNCGRCFCSNSDDCCPYCGCHCVLIGIQGDSAENYTTVHLSAIHTGGTSLTVPLGGVAVPMQNTILNGFTVNATFDTFTADFGGVYLLMYNIKTSVDTTVKTRIMRNGTQWNYSFDFGTVNEFFAIDVSQAYGRRSIAVATI